MGKAYRAIISSDWNECLAPCGPFDCIRFAHPELTDDLTDIFRRYAGNQMTLGAAGGRIESLMSEDISIGRMDAYLDEAFCTYAGVPDLIEWCRSHDILFMINTTGMIGYFQRVFAKKLLPQVPVLLLVSLISSVVTSITWPEPLKISWKTSQVSSATEPKRVARSSSTLPQVLQFRPRFFRSRV